MKDLEMKSLEKLINRNEIRRLEKSAREKNKIALYEWASQFEYQIAKEIERYYKKEYEATLIDSVTNYMIALVYTLKFCEKTNFGNNRIVEFMDDFMAVIDGFDNKQFLPDEYKQILKDNGIIFEDIMKGGNK
jgi:hypothetical protein